MHSVEHPQPAPVEAPLKSAHARYAQHTARTLGYGFRSLDAVDGYLFEISHGARRAYFSAGAGSPYAFNCAHANAIARDKAFAQKVLAEAGLPTIPSRMFFTNARHADMRAPGREREDARAFSQTARYPLFCKPINGAQGAFAEIITGAAQFDRYLARLPERHYAILVQPVIEAPEYRVFVLEGRVLFSYRKLPPILRGDGQSDLATLMRAAMALKRPDEPPAEITETLSGRDAAGFWYAREDIPPPDVEITIEGAANRALGGGSEAPRTDVPAPMAQFALSCAAALRLDLAAVDLFDRTATGEGLLLIEVNCNPAIKTLEDHGRMDLVEAIWRANFEAALR